MPVRAELRIFGSMFVGAEVETRLDDRLMLRWRASGGVGARAPDVERCRPSSVGAFSKVVLGRGEATVPDPARVPGKDDALRPRDLDTVGLQGREQALAEFAAGSPLLLRPNGTKDL